jgi:hypothetical protein
MKTEVTVRRFRLRSSTRATATALAFVVLVLLAAYLPLCAAARQLTASEVWGDSSALVISVACAGIGVVIAWHQPRNILGWLFLGIAVCFVLSTDSGRYAVADYRLRHGTWPLGPVALFLDPLWAPAIVAFGLVVLLFPDGRIGSRRWSAALWAYLGVGAAWPLSIYVVTAGVIAGHSIHVLPSGDLSVVDVPTGNAAWLSTAQAVIAPVLVVFWVAMVGRQALSWRIAGGERRQQLKWLMSGAAICVAGGGAVVLIGSLDSHMSAAANLAVDLLGFAVAALPVSIGVGILKYRLYEIDRIISRTLAYALVTGLLVGVYAGLVLLATHVLALASPVAVAASTLVAAALFSPLRRRVQRVVDRRFNRARYDADKTVAAFAARLKDAVDLDAVRADLSGVVHQALEPAHVSVWISHRD